MKGKVENYYYEKISKGEAILSSLIDPDKTPLEKGAKIAKESCDAGADIILVGGSIGAQGSLLDDTVKMIRENVNIPIVLFPGNISGLTPYADATYFMHMLNSKDIYWLSTALIQGAPVVERMKIEAIPTTYVVVEPGKAVGWIGNANLLPRERADLAYACALAAKYSGSHLLITDSGSGAEFEPPYTIIQACAKACGDDLLYFYAGGCRTPEQAKKVIEAGAKGIHIGTAFETGNVGEKVRKIKAVMKF